MYSNTTNNFYSFGLFFITLKHTSCLDTIKKAPNSSKRLCTFNIWNSTFGTGVFSFILSFSMTKVTLHGPKLLPAAAETEHGQERVYSTVEVGQDITWKGYTGFTEGRRSSVPEGAARIWSYYLLWRSQVGKCNLIIRRKKKKKGKEKEQRTI